MGNAHNMECTLSAEEVASFCKSTRFTADEVKALWYHFMTINSSHEFITRQQFQTAMLFKDSALLDRIFRVFDLDDDNQISFTEYLTCLNTISSKAAKEDKLKFSFHIYDFDGDNFISVGDLTAVLAATLREYRLVIAREDIDHIVQKTMSEAQPRNAGMISFEEYSKLVANRPHMMDHLTINISSIVAEYSRNGTIALSSPRGFQSAMNIKEGATINA